MAQHRAGFPRLPRASRHRALIAAAMLGLIASTSAPAQALGAASPSPSIPGFGSATLEAVDNAIAADATVNGSPAMTSYDSTGTALVSTGPGCSLARPTDDRSAIAALNLSMAAGNGCVGYARVSAEPGVIPHVNSSALTYLPYGTDGLSFVVRSDGSVPKTLTVAQLQSIYTCQNPSVKPSLPPTGSGLRSSWLRALAINEDAVDAGTYSCLVGTAAVQSENDGRQLTTSGIAPFSIAAYNTQQSSAVADTRGGGVLGNVAGVGNNTGSVVPNRAFYPSDVSFAVLTSGSVPKSLTLAQLRSIYTCGTTFTPYLPANGSVRTAWLALLGISSAAMTGGTYPCVRTMDGSGGPLMENDGRVLASRTDIVPYSITHFLGQSVAAEADLTGRSTLGTIGTEPAVLLNPQLGSTFTHSVSHVVPTSRVSTSQWAATFAGGQSAVCLQTADIHAHGFGLLTGNCGAALPMVSGGGGTPIPPVPPVPPVLSGPPGSYPDASTTGWRHTGVTLSSSGPITVTTPGTVIDGLDISGIVVIKADNVTVQRSRVTSGSYFPIRVSPGFSNVRFIDLEVIGVQNATTRCDVGINGGNFIQRVDVSNCADLLHPSPNSTIVDSYLHDPWHSPTTHNDGVQLFAGSHFVVQHNTILMGHVENAAIFVKADFGDIDDVTIAGNFLDGGSFTVFGGDVGTNLVTNVVVTGNLFGTSALYGQLLTQSMTGPVTKSGNQSTDGLPVH